MKKILIAILIAVSVSGYSQTKNFIDQNYIEVTGKAEMDIIPNEIYVSIKLNGKDIKKTGTVEEVEKLMFGKLKSLNIDVTKNLVIKDMASNLNSHWIKASDINTTKEYLLLLTDANKVVSVFRELQSVGISDISVDRVEHSEITKYRQDVKIEAIKAAKAKAESLTSAIGQTCGRALYIQEQNIDIYRGRNYGSGLTSNVFMNVKTDDRDLDIEFQKIKLQYTVLVKFELK
jgi:uncharacterized protein YggE